MFELNSTPARTQVSVSGSVDKAFCLNCGKPAVVANNSFFVNDIGHHCIHHYSDTGFVHHLMSNDFEHLSINSGANGIIFKVGLDFAIPCTAAAFNTFVNEL